MLTALLLMQLAANDEGRGALPVEGLDGKRLETRVRGAFHFAGAIGFSGYAFGAGPGLSAELGLTFRDRYSLALRLTVGSVLVVNVATLGLGLDLSLSDQVSLGAGVSAGLIGGFAQDLPSAFAGFVPVRLVLAPFPREAASRWRKGLSLFLEAAPGIRLFGSGGYLPRLGFEPEPSRFSMCGSLGVGYAWW